MSHSARSPAEMLHLKSRFEPSKHLKQAGMGERRKKKNRPNVIIVSTVLYMCMKKTQHPAQHPPTNVPSPSRFVFQSCFQFNKLPHIFSPPLGGSMSVPVLPLVAIKALGTPPPPPSLTATAGVGLPADRITLEVIGPHRHRSAGKLKQNRLLSPAARTIGPPERQDDGVDSPSRTR